VAGDGVRPPGAPDGLDRLLADAVHAPDLETRETALGSAYEAVARRFNALGLIEPVDPELRQFHNRPARVLIAYRFADPCLESVADPALRALPPIGGIDQVADTSDALNDPAVFRRFRDVWSPCPRQESNLEPLPRSNSRLRRMRPRG
jgi:hypothetical protein